MKNEGFILFKNHQNADNTNTPNKLSNILNQIDEGRGWRFTEEQADTLAKLVDNLIEQVRAYNKKRNKNRKRPTSCF